MSSSQEQEERRANFPIHRRGRGQQKSDPGVRTIRHQFWDHVARRGGAVARPVEDCAREGEAGARQACEQPRWAAQEDVLVAVRPRDSSTGKGHRPAEALSRQLPRHEASLRSHSNPRTVSSPKPSSPLPSTTTPTSPRSNRASTNPGLACSPRRLKTAFATPPPTVSKPSPSRPPLPLPRRPPWSALGKPSTRLALRTWPGPSRA